MRVLHSAIAQGVCRAVRLATLWLALVVTGLITGLLAVSFALPPAAAQQSADADALRWQRGVSVRQQEELRARIAKLQRQIEARETQRVDVRDALAASERALSTLNRQLATLAQKLKETNQRLAALQVRIDQQTQALAARRAVLAQQLRAQYASGVSPWAALLSGDNPQAQARQLTYLDYVARARAQAVVELREDIARLDALKSEAGTQTAALHALREETAQRQRAQQAEQRAHATLLAQLDGQLKAQRNEADRLARDEARLANLLTELTGQLARLRAEEARRAAPPSAPAQPPAPRGSAAIKPPAKLPLPVAGRLVARFGSAQPGGGSWRGVLFAAPEGAPVKAVADGTVVYGDWLRGFGNLLILDHGDELLTVYAYNQSLLAQLGQAVRAGEVIATVGATGGQAQSGLYFEIRQQGTPQDPAKFFR